MSGSHVLKETDKDKVYGIVVAYDNNTKKGIINRFTEAKVPGFVTGITAKLSVFDDYVGFIDETHEDDHDEYTDEQYDVDFIDFDGDEFLLNDEYMDIVLIIVIMSTFLCVVCAVGFVFGFCFWGIYC